MSKLIIGCGYLGRRVARLWKNAGEEVYAVTRSEDRAQQWKAEGLSPILADITSPRPLSLPPAKTILFAVGFDRTAGKTIREVYVGGLAQVLDALPPQTERLIYISSTGVYGQTDGDFVNESSPCNPTREGGKACREAEQLLQSHAISENSIILRLAGIYGPGRVPRLREIAAGEPLPLADSGWLNLIHVDDAAALVAAAESQPGKLFVVSDGNPVSRHDYYCEVARLIGGPAPTFTTPDPQSHQTVRAAGSKRINNSLMQRELGIPLQYPSYREGLEAILGSHA